MLKKLFWAVWLFFDRLNKNSAFAYAANTAFFIIISFFPFVMLLLTLVQFLPFTADELSNIFTNFVPPTIESFIHSIVDELFSKSSGTVLSITAVTAVWSASTGMVALIRGMNSVYEIEETRNYFAVRAIAILYVFVFLAALIGVLVILVFGNTIFEWIISNFPTFFDAASLIKSLRLIVSFLFLVVVFDAAYTVIPNRKSSVIAELPGAVLCSCGWIGFSYLYSFYIDNISNHSYLYGSLTAIVLLMLWLYFCMVITFIGAKINMVIKEYKEKKERP